MNIPLHHDMLQTARRCDKIAEQFGDTLTAAVLRLAARAMRDELMRTPVMPETEAYDRALVDAFAEDRG